MSLLALPVQVILETCNIGLLVLPLITSFFLMISIQSVGFLSLAFCRFDHSLLRKNGICCEDKVGEARARQMQAREMTECRRCSLCVGGVCGQGVSGPWLLDYEAKPWGSLSLRGVIDEKNCLDWSCSFHSWVLRGFLPLGSPAALRSSLGGLCTPGAPWGGSFRFGRGAWFLATAVWGQREWSGLCL